MRSKLEFVLMVGFMIGVIVGFIMFNEINKEQNIRLDNLERNQIVLSSRVDEIVDLLEVNENDTWLGAVAIEVTVTAYNAVEVQTDSTPNLTASNKKPKSIVAKLNSVISGRCPFLNRFTLTVFPLEMNFVLILENFI